MISNPRILKVIGKLATKTLKNYVVSYEIKKIIKSVMKK